MAPSGFQSARGPVRLSANKACPQGHIDHETSPDFTRVDAVLYSFACAFGDRWSDISLARYRRCKPMAKRGIECWSPF